MKCGCLMEYIPRSFQEQIKEYLEDKNKHGYWICPNCNHLEKPLGAKKKNNNLFEGQ